jgi:glycosyltransferase involved in cell wall biosynthesis
VSVHRPIAVRAAGAVQVICRGPHTVNDRAYSKTRRCGPWLARLSQKPPPGCRTASDEYALNAPMNILWVSTRLPHPLEDFERARIHHMLQELNREHPVTYLALADGAAADEAAARASEYATSLVQVPVQTAATGLLGSYRARARNVRSPLPYSVWKHRSAPMERKIEELVRDEPIDIAICDSLEAAVNVPAALPIPTVLFQQRVEAVAWHRPVILASNFLRKRYAQQQWYRMYAFERSQCRRFDHVIAASPEDLAWFAVEYGVGHASYLPAGVDTDGARPSDEDVDRGHLVFAGAMDFIPNEDAMVYFATEVLPRLPTSGLTLSIVGRGATAQIRELRRRDSRIHLESGAHDVRGYLRRAAVVIAPQRIGGGARREILQAMAMEKPIVATTVAVDGLPVRDGEHLLIADTPEQFASAVGRLLQSPSCARALGRRAGSLAQSAFTWPRIAARLAETCNEVIGSGVKRNLEAELIR